MRHGYLTLKKLKYLSKNTNMLLENNYSKVTEELKKGERSGFINNFNRKIFLNNLYKKLKKNAGKLQK